MTPRVTPPPFVDRDDAGRRLAEILSRDAGLETVVVGIGRGGISVAAAVARALDAPLDVLAVRKLRAPWQPGRVMGAVAADGSRAVDPAVVDELALARAEIDAAALDELEEARRRQDRYRHVHPAVPLRGKTVLLVDDGIATGASLRAAARCVKKERPARIVAAAPVASEAGCAALRREVDAVRRLEPLETYGSIGAAYQEYPQTDDAEIVRLLSSARASRRALPSAARLEEPVPAA